ncbi:MAG: hypothetical protein OXE84_13220 [Rhodobacteraceae bacterium]|nr:hypothetical protein [Paracoccaceae bacterium]
MSNKYLAVIPAAFALFLAGCGGGSDSTPEETPGGTPEPPAATNCRGGTIPGPNSTCIPAPTPAPTAFEEAGGTPGALLNEDGGLNFNATSIALPTKVSDLIAGLHGSKNPGMTWDEILNAQEVSLTIGTVTGPGKAVSVKGKELSDFTSNGTDGISAIGNTDKGDITTAHYMGIVGQLVCNGGDCKVTDDKLVGTWYFQGTDNAQMLVKKDDEYVNRDTMNHADWGVWLVAEGQTGKLIRLHRSGGPESHSQNDGGYTPSLVKVPGLSDSATYNGQAAGVSTLYESGTVGSFTATAKLTAKFDTTAKLSGEITGFQGNAVGNNWKLELIETNLLSNGATTTDDSAVGRGATKAINQVEQLATWSAELYGEDGKRPVGVVGDFDGHFADGQAVGVFHAE